MTTLATPQRLIDQGAINWAHPLSHKLTFAFLPTTRGLTDCVKHRSTLLQNSAYPRGGLGGRSLYNNTAISDVPGIITSVGEIQTYPVSLFVLYWTTAYTDYAGPFGLSAQFSNGGCAIRHAAAGTPSQYFYLYGVGAWGAGLTPYIDGRLNYSAVAADGTNARFMLNGQLGTTAVSSAWGAATVDQARLGSLDAVDGLTTGAVLAAYAWNRALTDAEMLMLYRDPYAMLRSVSPSYLMQGAQAGGPAQTVTWVGYIG